MPRRTAVEGLEYVTVSDGTPYLFMSTGNFGGNINVGELSESGDAWSLKSQTSVDPQYFGMGLTTMGTDTYMLTWKA